MLNLFTTGHRHTLEIVGRIAKYNMFVSIKPSGSTTFRIEITNHCNLRCRMCDHGSMARKPIFAEKMYRRAMSRAGNELLAII